jgi:hypothetical protein
MVDEVITENPEEAVSATAVEVTEEEEIPVVAPYTVVGDLPTVTDKNRRYVDALSEASRASAMGQNPVAAYQAIVDSADYDPEDRANTYLRSVEGAISLAQVEVDSGVPPEVAAEKRGLKSIPEASSTAMAEARAYVASLPSASQLSPKDLEDAAFNKYLQFLTAKVSDEIGWNLGTAGDIAGFLVPQENLRYNEVAKVLGVDYGAMDSLDYTDFLFRTSAYIKEEAPEHRQALVEKLLEAWPEIHGNNRLALVDFLQTLAKGDQDEDLVLLKKADNWVERLDQATLGGFTVGKVISGGIKALNVLKTAAKAKNIEAVADIITVGSKGGLSEAGVDPIDAISSLDPMKDTSVLVKGADNTYATEVGLIHRDVDIYLDAADRVNNYGLALSDSEKAAARNRAIKDLEDQEGVTAVSVKGLDEESFEVSYNVTTPDGVVRTTSLKNYTKDDLGGLVSKEGEGHIDVDLMVTSPNFRFIDDRKELIQLPEQLQFQGMKIQALYDGAIKAALKPLSRKEMKAVDQVLTFGDEFIDDLGQNVGKVFSREELVEEGVNGIKLTDKQYEAYTGVRKVVDHLYQAKNKEIISDMKAKGIKVVEWEGQSSPVKVYDTPEAALSGFRTASTKSHWVGVEGDASKTYGDALELEMTTVHEMYGKGFRLTRVADNHYLKSKGTNLEWAFVKADKVREPGGAVLNYRTGYMPKIKKDAFYFVKESHDVLIGGKLYTGGLQKTVRYFDNFMDASKYAEQLNKNDPDRYRVLADREMSAVDVNNEFISISGGLFTGKRSEGVPFGLKGTSGERADSLEGLQRYVRNIARNMPMNLYRTGIQERWLNHAKESGALPKNYLGSFEDAVHGRHLDLDNLTAPFLVDSHKQISFFTGLRTEEERAQLSRWRAISKRLEKTPVFGKFLARRMLNTSTEGMSSTLRGLTFHLMLGMYSPAQFAIQATGSLIALSINPVHGLKAIGQLPGFAAADLLIANPEKKAKFIEYMRSKGIDMDGYEMWDKSGLRESITNTNLDYHSMWTDKPYDANAFQKLLSNSTMFFKAGEMVSARVAFITSYNHWRAIPGNAKRAPDLSAMKEVLARAETYRLNMTRVNSAGFQQGLLSIPTQFQQVNTKFFEKLFGKKELTKKEKLSLIAAQSILFGAAGVPLAKSMLPHVIEMINMFKPEEEKINAQNTDPAILNALHNGTLAWLIQDVYDVESVITGRMALGQDFVENVFGLATEQTSLMDIATGPFKSVFDQAVSGTERTLTAFSIVASGEDATNEDFMQVGNILARSLMDMPASTRNLVKSYDMTHSQFFRNKKGRPVAEWGDLNTQTVVAQALGFSPQEVTDYHEINSRNLGNIPSSVFKTESDRIVRFLADMSTCNDAQQSRMYAMAVNSVLTKYERPEDRIKLIKEVSDKLKEPKDAWGKLMQGVMKDWHSELQNGLSEIHNQAAMKASPAVANQLAKRGLNKAAAEAEEQ